MNRRASASVIILVILILISLAFAGGGFYLFQKERAKNADLGEKLDEISTKQRITETKFEETKKMLVDLQLKYEEARNNIDTLGSNLEQEKKARLEAESNIEQLRIDLEKQKELRTDLEVKLDTAQADLNKTQSKLKNLDVEKAVLESKVKELEAKTQEIELGKIVVSPEPAVATKGKNVAKASPVKKPAPVAKTTVSAPTKTAAVTLKPPQQTGTEGNVLVVNRDYNFVVISLGSKNGVQLGQLFSIYHENKYLGDVKIEKVHEAMAAAGFLSDAVKSQVRENDKVVQKVK